MFCFLQSETFEGWWYKQTKESRLWPLWDAQQRPAYLFWILKRHQSFSSGFFFFSFPSTSQLCLRKKTKHCFWNNCDIYFPFNPSRIIETDKMPTVTALFLEGVNHRKHSFILFVCFFWCLDGEMIQLKGPTLCKVPFQQSFPAASIIQDREVNEQFEFLCLDQLNERLATFSARSPLWCHKSPLKSHGWAGCSFVAQVVCGDDVCNWLRSSLKSG